MEVFATGLGLGESPRWHDGRLWVCDWVAGEVLSYDESGDRRVELTMTGLPFSVDWLPDGRTVLTCDRGVVTADEDGTLTPYGATGQAWNEIVVDPRGHTFVNAAGFDLMGGEEPKAGFVWVVRPDGTSEPVADDVWFPNGMAVTADGRTLVVAESYGRCLTGFDIGDDGTLTNRRVWADLGEANPDGICLDAEGAVWYADPLNGCVVRVREGGEIAERIDVDLAIDGVIPVACVLGGSDRRTLYICVAGGWKREDVLAARTGRIDAVEVTVPGAGRP